MQKPPVPGNEVERIKALYKLKILDTANEQVFDDLTKLAAQLTGCPIALVSLVDVNRQWFKSRCGIDATETERDIAFCAYAINGRDILEVRDATKDPRFVSNPLVTGEPHIRFYAGVPLVSEDEYAYGTLCIADHEPGALSAEQRESLRRLASLVLMHMKLRLQQQQIQQSSLTLARLIEFLPEALITTDAQGGLLHVNSIAKSWHGVDPSTIPRSQWAGYFQLLDPATGARLALDQTPVARLLRGETLDDQQMIIHVNGQPQRIVSCSGDFLYDVDGQKSGVVVVMNDITLQKSMEKMKDELVSTISHELRTPLTAISGALSLVRSGILGSLPDAMTELVDVAYMNSQRLNSLINDLLDMDKLMAGRMKFDIQPLELQSVFDDTVRTMSPYAAPLGVGIRAEGGAGLKVMADSIRIGQVLANLMSNACKFSSQGGEVLLAGREAGGMIEVSVTDRGQGIPAEFHDRIFQKFSQVDTTASRSKGGTGLGLAICKEMIERMGGRIGFESEAGKGSRFWFTLPAA